MYAQKDNNGNIIALSEIKQADDWVEVAEDAELYQPYNVKRAAEYPPMADYLDAVVKGDTVTQQAYIDECLAVKAKYPKGGA